MGATASLISHGQVRGRRKARSDRGAHASSDAVMGAREFESEREQNTRKSVVTRDVHVPTQKRDIGAACHIGASCHIGAACHIGSACHRG